MDKFIVLEKVSCPLHSIPSGYSSVEHLILLNNPSSVGSPYTEFELLVEDANSFGHFRSCLETDYIKPLGTRCFAISPQEDFVELKIHYGVLCVKVCLGVRNYHLLTGVVDRLMNNPAYGRTP